VTNYATGANLERKLVNNFRQHNHFAIRVAGSHSAVDVIAIGTKVGDECAMSFIQSKKGKLTPKQKQEAIDKFKPYAKNFQSHKIDCILCEWYDGEPHFTNINGDVYANETGGKDARNDELTRSSQDG
jgi:Holliday junction resolvase